MRSSASGGQEHEQEVSGRTLSQKKCWGPADTIADTRRTGIGVKNDRHCELHSSQKTSTTASSPWSFEDSLRALATRTRTERHVGAWWRRPQARTKHSSPSLPSPAG